MPGRTCFAALLAALLAGCSCADNGGEPCSADADCARGQSCVDGRCALVGLDGSARRDGASAGDGAGPSTDVGTRDDALCGGEAVPFDYRPPNVLLIFDRSCSMRRTLDTTGGFGTGPEDPLTRWNTAREAVLALLASYPARIFWGLMAFPDPGEGCGMPVEAEVPPGPGTADAIERSLRSDRIQPFGLCGPDNSDPSRQPRDTPTGDALTSARALPELSDPMRRSFALLVTDGGVSCGVSEAELRALAADLRMRGIPVGVIGFATGAMEATLEAIASEGGLPRPGAPPSYYVAESRMDLDTALAEIAARVVSCELPLSSTPPDPSAIFVHLNDVPLASDPMNGWTYDAGTNSLVLHGEACDRLRSGDVRRIGISFGCAPSACEPRPEICNGLDEDCDDRVDEDCLM